MVNYFCSYMLGIHLSFSINHERYLGVRFHVVDDSSLASRKWFVSNPVVREAIRLSRLPSPCVLGYANLRREGDLAQWTSFYPFNSNAAEKCFKKKGIGRLLEIKTLMLVQETWPFISRVRHSSNKSGDRIRGLKERNLGNEYDLKKGLRVLRFLAAAEAHAYHTSQSKRVAAERLLERRRARRPRRSR